MHGDIETDGTGSAPLEDCLSGCSQQYGRADGQGDGGSAGSGAAFSEIDDWPEGTAVGSCGTTVCCPSTPLGKGDCSSRGGTEGELALTGYTGIGRGDIALFLRLLPKPANCSVARIGDNARSTDAGRMDVSSSFLPPPEAATGSGTAVMLLDRGGRTGEGG